MNSTLLLLARGVLDSAESERAMAELAPLLERARDVETLDAFDPEWWMAKGPQGTRECYVPRLSRSFRSETPDAARHAAAEAIRKGEQP